MFRGSGRGGSRGGGGDRGRGGHYGGGRYGGGSSSGGGFNQSHSQHGHGQVRGQISGYRAQSERSVATTHNPGMELVPRRGYVPGLPWLNPPPVRVSENLTMIRDAEPDEILDEREAWMDEHNNQAPTVAFMTPNLGDLIEQGLRDAKLDGGPDVPGEPIKFKIPIPDDIDEAFAAVRRYEIEEAARLSQVSEMEREQAGANQVRGRIRHQQGRAGYAGRGGMGMMRGGFSGGRNRGGFHGRGASRAQTQPFRSHQQAQRNQQLGQTRGRGGGFQQRGRRGSRAQSGWGGGEQQQQRSAAQTSKGQGLNTQAQADQDPAIGTECKVCRGLDHLEMDCARGSNIGSDSTWCIYHRGGVNENGTQECSGALDRCIGMMLNHERMEVSAVVTMVFDWIVRHRSSRPEPRCVGADWHWATCIAEYMEQHPEVEVTAEMLPVRRHEVKAREENKRADPTRTWGMFDFGDLVWSKSEFKDPYWDTKGDRAGLIKRLKEYAAAEPDTQALSTRKEEDDIDRVVKVEVEPELQAVKTEALIKEEVMDEF